MTPADEGGGLGEAPLDVGQIWPVLEAMVHTTGHRHETLDNTLRPDRQLSETMSLEEATRWLKTFESYLAWNESVINRKSPKCLRDLLESLLDTSLVSRMVKDESITERTTVRGSTGILNILKGYFVEEFSQQQDNIRP